MSTVDSYFARIYISAYDEAGKGLLTCTAMLRLVIIGMAFASITLHAFQDLPIVVARAYSAELELVSTFFLLSMSLVDRLRC